MSLALALNNALSGLNVNQNALAVLSQNIANANTAGYSRKIVNQQARYIDGRGVGVSIESVSRKVDEYLTRSIRLQNGAAAKANTTADYMDRTQLLLGNPGAGNSFDAYIGNFFAAVQALAQTPENSTLKVGMLGSAQSLANQSVQLAQGLQELRLQADQDIATMITSINKDLADLHQLNIIISQDSSLGKSVGELLDRRDAVLRDLAQYLDVQIYNGNNNQIAVSTAGGVPLVDESAYELSYQAAGSLDTFINETPLSPLYIYRLNDTGARVGSPITLATGGASATVATSLTTGRLKGLMDMRDRQIPAMLAQLDTLVANMRDNFNRVHNAGIAFPGASSYTGTRSVVASDYSQWSGSIRLAVLGTNGQPISSAYDNETSGMRPLTIDLASLNTGQGAGTLSMQGIINEINQYYGPPGNKVTVGNLNNIRLASSNSSLPGTPPRFNFDFDLENISSQGANFFITNIQVTDDGGTPMTTVTEDVPQIPLAIGSTYEFTDQSTTVTVNTTLPPGVVEGDTVFLSTPTGPTIAGIPVGQLGGYVKVTSVNGNSFTFETTTAASATTTHGEGSMTMRPPYSEAAAGEYGRTTGDGNLQIDLSANSSSDFYTITVDVGVEDEDGNISTSQITYRITNDQSGLLNKRYNATGANGDGVITAPSRTGSVARAILVDANGNELPKVGGQYVTTEPGYLKILATGSNVVALDSLDSNELGRPDDDPPVDATNRGFSYYFGLNNFFTDTYDDDRITGSAYNLSIDQRLVSNPNLISLGQLVLSPQPADGSPLYTYERGAGDNSVIQQLSSLANLAVSFAAAGGLGSSTQTFGAYAAAFTGAASNAAALAKSNEENAQILMDGYDQRASGVSGVNLDEELANTVIYQNAYTASARVISVASDLFDALLNSFQ